MSLICLYSICNELRLFVNVRYKKMNLGYVNKHCITKKNQTHQASIVIQSLKASTDIPLIYAATDQKTEMTN